MLDKENKTQCYFVVNLLYDRFRTYIQQDCVNKNQYC